MVAFILGIFLGLLAAAGLVVLIALLYYLMGGD